MKVAKQLEAASEMQLTKEDVAKLYKRWPLRYKGLAVAFGVVVDNTWQKLEDAFTKGSKQ
jgi:uncharacterized metal-binding protein